MQVLAKMIYAMRWMMSNYKIGGTNSERSIGFDSGSWTFVNDGTSVTHAGWGGIAYALNTSDASSIPSETGTKRKTALYIATAAYNKTPTDSMVYNSSFNCLAGWSTSTNMRWAYSSAKGGTQDEIHQDDPQCWVWYNGAYVDLSTTNPGNLFESGDHGYFSYSEFSSGSGDDIIWTASIITKLRASTIPQGFMTDWSVSGIGSCKSILQFVVSAPKTSEDERTYPASSQVLGTYTDVSSGSEQDVADLVHSSTTNLIKSTSQSAYANFPLLCRPATNIPWLKETYNIEPYYKGLPSTVRQVIKSRYALFGTLLQSIMYPSTFQKGIYCYYFVPGTDAVQYKILSGETSIQAALSAKTYQSYCSTETHDRYLMVSLTAGGGAGGRSGRVTNIEGAGGGGGGGGAGCIVIVRVPQNYCVLVEIGAGGIANSSTADGFESRLTLVSTSGIIRAGIVLDGGYAGAVANESSAGNGGAGGAPYKAASDGYSMGSQITSTYLSLPTTDTEPSSSYIIEDYIYIVAAAVGGAGGRGGEDAGLPTNNRNGTSGSSGYASNVSNQQLRTNAGSLYTIASKYSVGLNGGGSGSPYEGGGGGVAPCSYETSRGGNGGRGGQSGERRDAGAGDSGGGGGGGFYSGGSNYNGGNGGDGYCRVWY